MEVRRAFTQAAFIGLAWISGMASSHGMARSAPTPPPRPTLPVGPDQAHGEFVLRVLTYNIHGLPIPDNDVSRYADIGRELAKLRAQGRQPHVVGIQEAFHVLYKDLIREAAYPYRKDGHGPGEGVFIGSGLSILSEFPLSGAVNHDFDRENLVGFDWQARKGVQFARLTVPGLAQPIAFLNTHLQADYGDWTAPLRETIAARTRQYGELRTFLRTQNVLGFPALFVGDFNTHLRMRDYTDLVNAIELTHASDPCAIPQSCTTNTDPERDASQALDHQFYSVAGNRVTVRPIYYGKLFRERVNGRLLSDHEALEIHYAIRW